MFNIGYGSLVWMTATEILPAKIRSSTNGLTVESITVTIIFIPNYKMTIIQNFMVAIFGISGFSLAQSAYHQ